MGTGCSGLRQEQGTRATEKLANAREDYVRQDVEAKKEAKRNIDKLRSANREMMPVDYMNTLAALNTGLNPYTFMSARGSVYTLIKDILEYDMLKPDQINYHDDKTCNASSIKTGLDGIRYGEAFSEVFTDQERDAGFRPIKQELLQSAIRTMKPEIAVGFGASLQIPLDVQAWVRVVEACGTTLGQEKHRFLSDKLNGSLNLWAAVHCNLIDANMMRNTTRIKSLFKQLASAALQNGLQGMGEMHADSVTLFRVKCLPDETLEQTGELTVYAWCDFTHRFNDGAFIDNGQLGQLRLVPLMRLVNVPVWLAAAIAEGEDPSREIVTTQILRLNKIRPDNNVNVRMSIMSDDPAWKIVKLTQFESVELDKVGPKVARTVSMSGARSNTVKCWHSALKLDGCTFTPHGRNSNSGKDALIATQPQMLALLASSTHDDIVTPAAVFTDFSYWGTTQLTQVTLGNMTYKNASIGRVIEANRGSRPPLVHW